MAGACPAADRRRPRRSARPSRRRRGGTGPGLLAALRERGWRGDDELAEALESRLGNGPARLLRPLPVDLESLATALEGDPGQGNGAIDLTTGEVWQGIGGAYFEPEEDLDFDDPDRWLLVPCEGSGRGAFRRFRNQLNRWPELETQWYAYSEERQRAGPENGWPRRASARSGEPVALTAAR